MLLQKKDLNAVSGRRGRIRYVKTELITHDSLENSDEKDIAALAASISRYGMLHPLTVRRKGKGFELICGMRRLSAAKLCGQKRVPCRVISADDREFWSVRLSENLHRHQQDFLDTAEQLKQLIYNHGYSVEEAAAQAGLTVRQVVSKLRILRLPRHMLMAIRDSGLTERHALALLRITQEDIREAALCEMAYMDMGPEAAEKYVTGLLKTRTPEELPGQRPLYIVKDVRMFLNSITHGIDMMRGGGIDAECIREECDNCIKLTIRIPDKSISSKMAG
ncbi:MAG: ParB/RepB/Spo0J family partition protein [Oscillospiraceae bacterium]